MKRMAFGLAVAVMFVSSAYVLARDSDRNDDREIVEEVWDDSMPGHQGHDVGMPARRVGVKKRIIDKRKRVNIRRGEGMEKLGDRILEVIKEHDPDFAKELGKLKDDKPMKYRVVVKHAGKMLLFAKEGKDEELEKDIVKGMALDYEARELGLSYQEASGKEKERIKKELKNKISRLFDLKLKGQEERIKKMDEKISKLRKNLAERKTNKDTIVKNRVNELIGEADSWKW